MKSSAKHFGLVVGP